MPTPPPTFPPPTSPPPPPSPSVAGWTLQTRPESFTLSRSGTGAGNEVLSFDAEGRLLTWFSPLFAPGTLYKRALDSRLLGRRQQGGQRRRWQANEAEQEQVFAALLGAAAQAQADLASPLLDRVLAWTPARLRAEQERFAAAYAPVSILPPDQYFAVVVQATRGCSWNRCTFCTFYRDRPFSVQTPSDFAAHLRAVADLLGEGARLRRSLFLADGNALMLSNGKLLPLIAQARAAFPGREVHGFLDVFTGSRKSVADWQELREAGVRRVYLGLETGHDPLLAWLDKPGSAAQATALIHDLKAAGLNVAPIFMTGVGGQAYAAAHLADTRRLLERLPLGAGDLVYLSPFVPHGDYAARARDSGVLPLTPAEREAQAEALRGFLRAHKPGVQAARYDIEEFMY